MGTGVHAQATGTTTEAITFGSVFASVAVLAEELCLVFCAVGGVQHLAAKSTFEARFVVFVTTGDTLFSGIYGLAALGAFRIFYWLERHFLFVGLVGSLGR